MSETTPAPDSASGGYLVSQSSPYEDTGLSRIMQQFIVGVSGLPPAMVRVSYQNNPAPQPGRNTDWCAIKFVDRESIDYPSIVHDPTAYGGIGGDWLYSWEEIKYVMTFYGPNSDGYSTSTRAGFYLPQNWEILRYIGFGLKECKHVNNAPELVNKIWLPRADIMLTIRRQVKWLYPIRSLLSAEGTITTVVVDPVTFDTLNETIGEPKV